MLYFFQASFDMLLECFHKNGEQLNWVKEILFKIQSWKVMIGLQNFSWDGAYVSWKADDEMLGGPWYWTTQYRQLSIGWVAPFRNKNIDWKTGSFHRYV